MNLMNLQVCENCGVVINLVKVKFIPERDEEGLINHENIWVGDYYSKTWKCPVCEELNPSYDKIL